jgi:hypothetical protein
MGDEQIMWANRNQFFSVSARLMRQILIDFARARATRKRGDDPAHLAFDAVAELPSSQSSIDPALLIDLDQALTRLA